MAQIAINRSEPGGFGLRFELGCNKIHGIDVLFIMEDSESESRTEPGGY